MRASAPAKSDRWIPGFQNSTAHARHGAANFQTSLGIQTWYSKTEDLAENGFDDCIRLDKGYTPSMSSYLPSYGRFPFELNILKKERREVFAIRRPWL
jgi:hypothetical protein